MAKGKADEHRRTNQSRLNIFFLGGLEIPGDDTRGLYEVRGSYIKSLMNAV